MSTIINAPKQIRFYAAAIALAALAITLLAVSSATGPAQAQNSGNLATYPDPQPCGPGANTAFMEEPHEVRTGHYALFDAYWRITGRSLDGDSPDTGVLYINECPPEMVPDGFGGVTRVASGIDIDEAIMHVLDKHKAGVVATNAQATAGQLSLEEYDRVRKGLGLIGPNKTKLPVPAGTQVWWLQLDDPDTTDDETSDLGMGFSTALFDSKYWLTSAEGKPMRYKLEVESYPGDPTDSSDVPHFFTYKAPKAGGAAAVLVWDGFKPGDEERDMLMDPGEYEALQWVFTKPGTYVLLVEFQGHVRQSNPHTSDHPDYDANWKPISSNLTETRAAKYTFHVGPKLDETEPPIFGVNLSVPENSPAGAKVGGPVPVYNADAEVLYYDLIGEGKENFKTVAGTNPHTVQIVVAEGASLDFETRPSYDLQLTVTDNLDHQGNPDKPKPVIDDTLIVRISLDDQKPGLDLQVDQAYPAVGETVYFIARYEPTPEQRGQTFSYQWAEQIQTKEDGIKWHVLSSGPSPTWSVLQSTGVSKVYRASVVVGNDTPPILVNSEDIRVTWEN